jgi:uncharacterized membrane protein YkvA (DUF1232 family)
VSEHLKAFKEWVETFPADVETLKTVVQSESVPVPARKLVAAALSYLVTRLDLVPDHNETIGVLDDVFVVRTCLAAAGSSVDDGLSADATVEVGRLVNEADRIEAFLGKPLYARFKAYCQKLADSTVRGRTTAQIVSDAAVRKALYVEIDDDLKKLPPAQFNDSEDELKAKLISFLKPKLPT